MHTSFSCEGGTRSTLVTKRVPVKCGVVLQATPVVGILPCTAPGWRLEHALRLKSHFQRQKRIISVSSDLTHRRSGAALEADDQHDHGLSSGVASMMSAPQARETTITARGSTLSQQKQLLLAEVSVVVRVFDMVLFVLLW